MTQHARIALLGVSLTAGSAASTLAPGCVFPDYCIVVISPGTDWCLVMEDAVMWPIDEPELAQQVLVPEKGLPMGCQCFNDADVAILADQVPADVFLGLVAGIETTARNKCALAVPPGYDHNCYVEDGPLAPGFIGPIAGEPSDSCIGSCGYVNPPPFGTCGDDPDPYECNEEYGGEGDTGLATDTGQSNTDAGESGPDLVVSSPREVLR